MEDIKKLLDDIRRKEQAHIRRYGRVKPIISAQAKGFRFIAVGSELHYSEEWRTFPDFLRTYIWHVIGERWFNHQIKKPTEEQHPIMKWWILYHEFSKKQTPDDKGLIGAVPNSATKAFYQLAYDLYILRHHQALQEMILRRLLTMDGFQGARYELFATSTMIRAGFSIEFEDESDRSRKHVEFVAVHKDTGERIAIEAKSRHRPGVLGVPGRQQSPEEIKLRLGRLINAALEKDFTIPLVVFIDMNLPPEKVKGLLEGDDITHLVRTLDQVNKTDDGKDLFNLILYTNHPYHYGSGDEPYELDHVSVAITQTPKYVMNRSQLMQDIAFTAKQYGNIPNEFPEEWDGTIS